MVIQVPPGLLREGIVARARALTDPAPPLFPEEISAIARAVPKRVIEFTAGRAAARDALEALGVPRCAVLSGPDRIPRFPTGVVGSLSHSRALAFAAVSRRSDLSAIGVDVEEDEPLDSDLIPLVTSAAERRDAPRDQRRWAKLMFSAKEAVFKCWCTGGGARLADFQEFEVEVSPDGEVRVRRQPTPSIPIRGRWARADGAFWVLASSPIGG